MRGLTIRELEKEFCTLPIGTKVVMEKGTVIMNGVTRKASTTIVIKGAPMEGGEDK